MVDTRRSWKAKRPPEEAIASTQVLDLLNATNQADHNRRVVLWAESVRRAWEPHHGTVRAWADEMGY